MIPDPEAVEDREFRVAQGILAVGLLAAFVFGLPWIVPAALLVTGLGAAIGPAANPLHAGYRALLGRREIGGPVLPPVSAAISTPGAVKLPTRNCGLIRCRPPVPMHSCRPLSGTTPAWRRSPGC